MPKKGKARKRSSTSSSNDQGMENIETADEATSCCHVSNSKVVMLSSVKTKLRNRDTGICDKCQHKLAKQILNGDSMPNGKMNSTSPESDHSTTSSQQPMDGIWLCLTCGHQGCGRLSSNWHALTHFDAPKSGPSHSLALHIPDGCVWCYSCDMEVPIRSNNKLHECVTFLKTIVEKKLPLHLRGHQQPHSVKNIDPIDKQPVGGFNNVPKHDSVVVNGSVSTTTTTTTTGSKKSEPPADKTGLMKAKLTTSSVKGMLNLGNTCFFNSVMQSLNQTHALHFVTTEFKSTELSTIEHLNLQYDVLDDAGGDPAQNSASQTNRFQLTISVDAPGPLTSELSCFLMNMAEGGGGTLSPVKLFNQICRKASRFRGGNQQDGHELLRYLIEGVQIEEKKRFQSAILRAFGLNENTNPAKVDDDIVLKMNAVNRLIGKSFVERIFGGTLLSSIHCLECGHISLCLEPFYDLSLPIVDETSFAKWKQTQLKLRSTADHVIMVEQESRVQVKVSKHQAKKTDRLARKNKGKKGVNRRHDEKIGFDGAAVTDDVNKTAPTGVREKKEDSNDQSDVESMCDGFGLLGLDEPLEVATEPIMTARAITSNDVQNDVSDTEIDSEEEFGDYSSLDMNDNEIDKSRAMIPLCDDMSDWRTSCSIGTCLSQFTAIEILAGKSAYACENCLKIEIAGKATQVENPILNILKGKKTNSKFKYTKAEKRMLLYSVPPVLTFHLKRFEQIGFVGLRKVNKKVEFPLVINIAPYCSSLATNVENVALYSLYAIVEHSGTMRSGHYVAFVKVRKRNEDLIRTFVKERFPNLSKSQSFQLNSQGQSNGCSDNDESNCGQWFYVSDSRVNAVNESRVLTAEAYILFYERLR